MERGRLYYVLYKWDFLELYICCVCVEENNNNKKNLSIYCVELER